MNVKTNLTDYPEVVSAREKLVDLQLKLIAIETRLNELRTTVGDRPKDRLDTEAENLLSGKLINIDEGAKQLRDKQTHELCRERDVVNRAIEIQKYRLREIERLVSMQISEKLLPEYKIIQQKMAGLLLELQEMAKIETEFRRTLEVGGVTWTSVITANPFRPCGGFDGWANAYTEIARWFKAAVREGYLKKSDVPEPWRDHWGIPFVEVRGEPFKKSITQKVLDTVTGDGWVGR